MGGRDENQVRGNWSSKWDYLLTLAGYAIGIGNVWRFPYLCYKNGGGAFLIPYLIMLVVVGLPLFFLESALGQFNSSGSISLYNVSPIFKGIGYATFGVSLIASTYYSMLVAYPLVYLYHSLAYQLPWATCTNHWNTASCSSRVALGNDTGEGPGRRVSPADEFLHNFVLEISPGIEEPDGTLWWLVLANFLVWAFVFLCVFKGVKVLGKVVWFTAIFPFVMLLVLFFRGVTLPGARDGILYYIYPDFSKLANLSVWGDAAVQIFFSLGCGWGSLVSVGSFNRFHNNCLKDALVVPLLNCATSVFAGFVVFSVLGFLAHQMHTPIPDVTTAGATLAFIVYPEALALMPLAPVWSALFFLMLFFLGIDSIFVLVEAIVVSITDEFPALRDKRLWVSFVFCAAMFLGSLFCCTRGGLYVVHLLDQYSVSLPITLAALLEILVFFYVYGGGRVVRDLEMMTSRPVSPFWYLTWIALTPLVLLFILTIVAENSDLFYRGYAFPVWAKGVGWLTGVLPLLAIPAYMAFYLLTAKGDFTKRLSSGLSPTPSWGPKLENHRQAWTEYIRRHPLQHRLLHHAWEDRRLVGEPPAPEVVLSLAKPGDWTETRES